VLCTATLKTHLTPPRSIFLELTASTCASYVDAVPLAQFYNEKVVKMVEDPKINIDTSQIKNWRSIVTLIVFVLTSE